MGKMNLYTLMVQRKISFDAGKCKTYDTGVYFYELFDSIELKEMQDYLTKRRRISEKEPYTEELKDPLNYDNKVKEKNYDKYINREKLNKNKDNFLCPYDVLFVVAQQAIELNDLSTIQAYPTEYVSCLFDMIRNFFIT